MTGRRKFRKALPYNVLKMAPNYRERLALVLARELFNMADTKSILSLSNRPFQDAKVCGKVVCSKCIESNRGIKLFFYDDGLKQHFKVKHRGLTLDHNVEMDCKRQFRELHANETLRVLEQLTNLRLEKVCSYILWLNERLNSYKNIHLVILIYF